MRQLFYYIPFQEKYFNKNIVEDVGLTVFSIRNNSFENNGSYHFHSECYIMKATSFYFKEVEYSEHVDLCMIVTSNHLGEDVNINSFYTIKDVTTGGYKKTLFPYGKVYLKFKSSTDYTKYKLKA